EAPSARPAGEAPHPATPASLPGAEVAASGFTGADEEAPRATPEAGRAAEPVDERGAPQGERADQAVDLRALAAHTLEFTDELERAWSAALEPGLLGAAQAEFEARFASLLRTIERRVSAGARALQE